MSSRMKNTKKKRDKESEAMKRPYISVAEASLLLGISQDTIRRQIINGIIPAFNLGERLTRIDREALERLFQKDLVNLVKAHGKDPKEAVKTLPPAIEGHYSITEIIDKFDVTPSRVYSIINKYDLPKKKVGRYTYVPKAMADDLFAEYKKLYKNFEEALQNKSNSSPTEKFNA